MYITTEVTYTFCISTSLVLQFARVLPIMQTSFPIQPTSMEYYVLLGITSLYRFVFITPLHLSLIFCRVNSWFRYVCIGLWLSRGCKDSSLRNVLSPVSSLIGGTLLAGCHMRQAIAPGLALWDTDIDALGLFCKRLLLAAGALSSLFWRERVLLAVFF